jgi:acyl-phosphate glycerol 3-phosphate acyltransferase
LNAVYPVLATVAAYLLGSLSFAVIVTRLMGLNDPRTYGSKNPGATNVLRSGSKAAAIVTLLLDAVKGLAARGAGALVWQALWHGRRHHRAGGAGSFSGAPVARVLSL